MQKGVNNFPGENESFLHSYEIHLLKKLVIHYFRYDHNMMIVRDEIYDCE